MLSEYINRKDLEHKQNYYTDIIHTIIILSIFNVNCKLSNRNTVLFIFNEIQEKYEIQTNIVCSDQIQEIINYRDQLYFYLVPKLSQNLKVLKSYNIISHDLCLALRFLVDELNKLGYLFTP